MATTENEMKLRLANVQQVYNKITLKKGHGSSSRGGGQGGFYWHIHYQSKRRGCAFINLVDREPFGTHPSMQVFVNKKDQNMGIGREAFKQGCELSGYPVVYAYTAKKNAASIKAACAAGFAILSNKPQVILKWVKK